MNAWCVAVAVVALAMATPTLAGGKGSGGGSHYVSPHVTKNGTYVQGHYRSNPNATTADNWSTKGNYNPYTNQEGKVDAGTFNAPAAGSYSPPQAAPIAPVKSVANPWARTPSKSVLGDQPNYAQINPYRLPSATHYVAPAPQTYHAPAPRVYRQASQHSRPLQGTTNARQLYRSAAMRSSFQRTNPCPATGMRAGACVGWQIDHRTPLKCGGADAPANMQWLTVAAHKAKTAQEAASCRR